MNGDEENTSLGRDIDQILNQAEKKIKELRELNRPALDAFDKQEIEQRLKILEEGELLAKTELETRIKKAEDKVRLMSSWLSKIPVVLLGVLVLMFLAILYKIG